MNKIYKELTDILGTPGHEHEVRKYVMNHMSKHNVEIVRDRLGSVFAVKKSTKKDAPTVMLAGHMDEVGAIVNKITPQGMIKMVNTGGINFATYVAQKLCVVLDDGTKVPGITASTPPHLGGQASGNKFSDLLLDIGAKDKAHAEKMGIRPGQMITSENDYFEMGDNRVAAKAWDDRLGVGVALEVLDALADVDLDCNIVIGATVQEEVGLRGAITASQMIKPDIFLAVDCSPCEDYTATKNPNGALGEGFLLRILDPRCIMHNGIKKHIVDLAKEKDIKWQYYTSMGGTDAAAAQYAGDGVIVATIGCPTRYIHSPLAIIDKFDHEQVKKMSIELIKSINSKSLQTIKDNL